MISIARRGLFRRVVDAIFGSPAPVLPPKPPAPPPEPAHEPPPPPSSIFVPPEESGIPPGPYERLEPYEKVLHSEGLIDYTIFDVTGQVVVVDQYAADLIYQGWFDPDATPDQRHNAREDYYVWSGDEPRDFDWQTWRDWYTQSAA